jgi:lysophospholipase L1-like esterase
MNELNKTTFLLTLLVTLSVCGRAQSATQFQPPSATALVSSAHQTGHPLDGPTIPGTAISADTPTLVADGNALVYSGFATDGPHTFFGRVKTKLAEAGLNYNAYNKGVDGKKTAQMLTNEYPEYDSLINRRSKRNAVIMWEIGNDISYLDADGPTAYEHVVQYVKARKAAGWNQIIILTDGARRDIKVKKEEARHFVNQKLKQNAMVLGVTLVDIAADERLSNPENSNYFNPADGVHLTDAGYEIAAAGVANAIIAFNLK